MFSKYLKQSRLTSLTTAPRLVLLAASSHQSMQHYVTKMWTRKGPQGLREPLNQVIYGK